MERYPPSLSFFFVFVLLTTRHVTFSDLSHRSEQDEKKPTTEDFRTWLKHVTSLTAILKRHGDRGSIDALKDQRARLQEMLFAMGIGHGSKRGQKCPFFFFFGQLFSHLFDPVLPKPLRRALSLLPSQKQVDLLTLSLREELVVSNPISDHHGSDELSMLNHDLKFDRAPDIDWNEGVEEYQRFSIKELWTMLGRPDQTVPSFNAKQDPDGHHNAWSDDGAKWLQASSNGIPLNLRWHQIVGVMKMMENGFSGKPVLLMDGVGLGKTIQVSAYIALLSWYRDHFEIHGKFPGNFGAWLTAVHLPQTGSSSLPQLRGNGTAQTATSPTIPPSSLYLRVLWIKSLTSSIYTLNMEGSTSSLCWALGPKDQTGGLNTSQSAKTGWVGG